MKDNLIIVKQLPIIEENLKKLSSEIDVKIEYALSLECTEDNKQKVKKERSSLNNQFNELENQRKLVKNKIMAPYEIFENVYRECITNKFNRADVDLKKKIDAIESEQKKQLEDGARKYFEEYKTSKNIDFIKYENINLKIGVSDNLTKLQKQITIFVDKVADDLSLIDTQNHEEEILVEYMKDLNVSRSIKEVQDRHLILEQVKVQQESKKETEQKEQEIVKKVECVQAPVELEKETTIVVRITTTRTKFKEIISFLEVRGIRYE